MTIRSRRIVFWRRMKMMKKDVAEEKWTHYDDVSVAAISMG